MTAKENIKELAVRPGQAIGQPTGREAFEAWSDWDQAFEQLRSSFDDMFWGRGMRPLDFEMGVRMPAMDIEETDKAYILALNMPGMTKDGINIEVNGNVLQVSAESKRDEEEKGKSFIRRERHYGSYTRAVEFPEDIKVEDIDARMEHGVLRVTVPKMAPKESVKKKVHVK